MDPLTIGMLAILAVLIFFMFRNSRKRKAAQEEIVSKMVPGAEVMTSFGLFGTLKSVDEVTNVAELEIAPGQIVRIHRQTLTKVVEPTDVDPDAPRSVEEAMLIADREQAERDAQRLNETTAISHDEPEFGKRQDPDAGKPGKKAGE